MYHLLLDEEDQDNIAFIKGVFNKKDKVNLRKAEVIRTALRIARQSCADK